MARFCSLSRGMESGGVDGERPLLREAGDLGGENGGAGGVPEEGDAKGDVMAAAAAQGSDGGEGVEAVDGDGSNEEEEVVQTPDVKQTPGAAAAAAWREAAWEEADGEEFVDVLEGDVDEKREDGSALENGEDLVASRSLAVEGDEEGYGSCADIGIEEDAEGDASRERLEEEAMTESIREYVTEAVLADHIQEQPDKSKSESEHVKVAQHKSQIAKSREEGPKQSGGEPSVVVEELNGSSSSDDESKATSAPPARSISGAAGRSNGPSLPSRPAGLGASTSLSQPSARPVLYRLGLAEQLRRNTGQGVFSFDRAQDMAERLEAAGNEPLDFSCTILVLGKTGVGKSATINSIFDDVRLETNAFDTSTRKVQEVVGAVEGIKVKVIDTPGLSCSSSDQHHNQKILNSVKRLISRNPPDIVLYFDRLDMQTRDYGDVPLLQTITRVFGASIWFNAIVVLTHAASAPPDGLNGIPLSYEMFVTQRSHVVQQAIRQAAGDVRLMNPVSLVENHSACRTNRAGQRVLPNGHVWKPQLLLLCFASKVLAEANALLKLQDNPAGKPRMRIPPLPFLLSSLLQSRAPLKLPEEQFGDDDDIEDDLADDSDSDDGSDYDDLPPFKRLTKAQLAKLNHAQRKAYLEELDYREKLFYKKQLKEERMRCKIMKKMAAEASARTDDFSNSNLEDDGSAPTNVAVPMPDMVLPSSFDSDHPSHRYRFLDTPSEWLVRPVLETQGWDHDVGYEGLNVERLFAVKGKVPLSVSGQLSKDKKDCSLQMEVASSLKHGEGKTTSLGLDLQSVGKDMAYTLRGESRFKNFRRNNTAAGISATLLGDSVSAGVKVEDKLVVNKQLRVLVSGGAMSGRGDVAYGGRLEATLKDKDYPIGRMLSTIALSVVDWHGDLAVGCNIQSQIPAGRASNLIGHANLSNKGTGQVGIRLNSSEHLEIALIALVPIYQNIKKLLQS
uniref:AIG1-type G domain-containing protein n=1 Tax=Oryza nivara TaxID=4536 RepID=A0A0E0IW28_ORYNI